MSDNVESYVLFELADNVYALPSRNVLHIEMFEHVTLVPNANPAIDGVVFSRGQVMPALNLRVRFGLPREKNTVRTRIIFTTIHDRAVGLIVDSAREFRSFPASELRPVEETLTGINDKYLRAVVKLRERVVLILDLEAVLNLNDVQLPSEALTLVENTTSKV
ncbi:MAG TPA: chemotaxis protein CheW [Verrucomicrobiae bacterium]|jgi:purine-binding chemotaxis protein CheW|nr:chemotaxis protein CheW [Verrucomicrobiae bacterium]